MAPAFWFAQTAQLDEHLARETKVTFKILRAHYIFQGEKLLHE